MFDETKKDILTQVKDNINQIYSDFEMVTLDNEVEGSLAGVSDPGLTDKIESLVQQVQADTVLDDQGSSRAEESFQTLAGEFSVSERTSAPISTGLAEIVDGLLTDILPKKKLQEVQPNRLYTIRQVASLIGSLVSSFPRVEFGPLHYRALEADKDYHLNMHQGNFNALMSLSAGSLEDLNWWVFHLPSASKNIYHSPPNLILHTDASGIGWGATLSNGSTTRGIWSQAEASRHINYLELQSVYLALSSLLNNEKNVHVRVMCDNVTAVTYINKMGGCKSAQCNSVAKLIWNWAIARRIWVSAAHVAGSTNVDADHLSRNVNLNLEWMLSTDPFQAIVNKLGQPDIDLFASRLNAQLETYVSWKRDPKAKYIDAFSIVWSGFFYAFPPFCLVSRCVQKIIQDKATGILVVPLWPTQPFFSMVLSLLIEVPRMLKVTRHNWVHPTLETPHPLQDQLTLLVCKLYGDPWRTQTFHQTLLTSSCIPGDIVLTNSMTTTSRNGCSLVVKGRVIPCVQM